MDHLLSEYRRAWRIDQPEAVAHRVVHGGEKFRQPTLLDDAVLNEIEQLNVAGAAAQSAGARGDPPGSAVAARYSSCGRVRYGLSCDLAGPRTRVRARQRMCVERFGIRRFGFHGINHSHVASSVASYLEVDLQALRIISCHLGNGASVTAIEAGRSVETSMGMTPLEGLVMGTRAGDMDPGVLLQLFRSGEFDAEQLDELLNKRSGLKGLTGSNDMREIEKRASAGDEDCRRAIALYVHRVRKYIGAYAVAMGGVDVVAFTGGVGENSSLIRPRCLERLEFLGIAAGRSSQPQLPS